MNDRKITKTVLLSASRETVWTYLTDKDRLGEWFYPAEADLAPGREYVLFGAGADEPPVKKCWGTVTKMEPPALLVYTFSFAPLAGALTTVSWTLEEADGGTRLTLEHQGIAQAAGASADGLFSALDAGWDKHLDRLRDAARRG